MSLREQDTISVRDARDAARKWAREEAALLPGFVGAYIAGSTTWLADDVQIASSSDVDVKVILDSDDLPDGPQKVPWRSVVLDISYAPLDEVRSAECVLANYYTAGHLARDGIIADPTGHLHAIQPQIEREYPRRRWVHARALLVDVWRVTDDIIARNRDIVD